MKKRIEWIDCAKLMAITAVVTDHCNGFLYTKSFIANASYFSVSLFVLLAGISTWISCQNGKEISFAHQFEKAKKLLCAYAIATLIVLCVAQRKFDLKTYLSYLIGFNIQAPYYYIVFFLQLLMIAPVLVNWCKFVNSKKCKWIMQLATMSFLGWLAYISINYTYILPVHGGGQFVWGGTYVILYYLGMLLSSNGVFEQSRSKRMLITFFCTVMAILWVCLMTDGKLPFDRWMSPYWGYGFNPPSINFMVYSLLVLFICYGVFSLLYESGYKATQKVIALGSFLGRNTLYIWLYHLLVINVLFPDVHNRSAVIRIIVFGLIIILPVIIKQLVYFVISFYYNQICQREGTK